MIFCMGGMFSIRGNPRVLTFDTAVRKTCSRFCGLLPPATIPPRLPFCIASMFSYVVAWNANGGSEGCTTYPLGGSVGLPSTEVSLGECACNALARVIIAQYRRGLAAVARFCNVGA